MIASLQGKIILKKENFIILEVSGVGYELFLSARSLERIPEISQNLKFFCYLDVGERSLKLFGFLNYEELELFKLLRNIQGIGPKAALEISSIGSPEKIKKEIKAGNEKIFEGIPGIGPKKARKIILELSGKLKNFTSVAKKEKDDFSKSESFSALVNLGFKKEEVKKVLSQLPKEMAEEKKIKEALKTLSR